MSMRMGSGMLVQSCQPTEEFQCDLDIESNLFCKKFGGIESSFFTDAMQELQSRRTGSRDRISQHEGFNCGRALAKCRPHTDVGNRVEILSAIERDSGDVDSKCRQQFV